MVDGNPIPMAETVIPSAAICFATAVYVLSEGPPSDRMTAILTAASLLYNSLYAICRGLVNIVWFMVPMPDMLSAICCLSSSVAGDRGKFITANWLNEIRPM